MIKRVAWISGCITFYLQRSQALIKIHPVPVSYRRFSTNIPDFESDKEDITAKMARKLGLNSIERHIFLCCDQSKPKCCSSEEGIKSWDYLKMRMKELNLVGNSAKAQRTKANCLQICSSGPIAVVYPDGNYHLKKNQFVDSIFTF